MTSAPAQIAVVIVNFRTAGMVADCLASLEAEVAKAAEAGFAITVHIGDAASGDGSVEAIASAIAGNGWSDWAGVRDIGENGGFAFGNNHVVQAQIVSESGADYIHFLNPDTVIHPGAVIALARHLEAHPQAGAAGSRLENPDGSRRAYAFRFPRSWREFFRGARLPGLARHLPRTQMLIANLDDTREVDWVTGASFMTRADIFEALGGMDAGFFLYFEETDYLRRLRDAGWQVWHVAESRVVHLAGGATGVRNDGEALPLSDHWLASRRRYFEKHHGRAGALLADIAFLAGDLVFRTHSLLRGRRPQNPPHLWRSYLSAGRQ